MYKLTPLLAVFVLFTTTGLAQEQKESTWCLRFAVVEKTRSDSENWGVWPEDATQWWQKDGKKKFRELCDSTLENADFVLAWEKKLHHQEVCDPEYSAPDYPDRSQPSYPDYSPPNYPDYSPPAQPDYSPPTYPDYSQPPYSVPSPVPPGTGTGGSVGTVCLACRSSLDTSPVETDHRQPGTGIVLASYIVSSSSSPDCRDVEEERVSVNVYRAQTAADKFMPGASMSKKEGWGGKPGKGAFQGAMKTLRKEAKKAGAAKTRQ